MSTLKQIQLPDGQVIFARIATPEPSGGDDEAAHDVGFTSKVYKLAGDQLTNLAGAVVKNVRDSVCQYEADEVTVDFGIEISATSGTAISALAEIGGTASIVVHLTWRGDKAPEPGE
jgi:hypothetical protein